MVNPVLGESALERVVERIVDSTEMVFQFFYPMGNPMGRPMESMSLSQEVSHLLEVAATLDSETVAWGSLAWSRANGEGCKLGYW
ncbi:unnamed protein product [Caretta caretta]